MINICILLRKRYNLPIAKHVVYERGGLVVFAPQFKLNYIMNAPWGQWKKVWFPRASNHIVKPHRNSQQVISIQSLDVVVNFRVIQGY